MTELTIEAKLVVLTQKLQGAKQQYYSHKVDAQVAQDIGGLEDVLNAARDNMGRMQKFIDAYEELIKELAKEKESD